jgi:vacuolar-type H+-ATPase subunit H
MKPAVSLLVLCNIFIFCDMSVLGAFTIKSLEKKVTTVEKKVTSIVKKTIKTARTEAKNKINELKPKVEDGEQQAKQYSKEVIKDVKKSAKKVDKSSKVAKEDWKEKKWGAAIKDSGKVVKNSLDVVGSIPVVGSPVKSGEQGVSDAIAMGKDLDKIYKDAEKEGMKKAIKKYGKDLGKNTWGVIKNTTSAISDTLLVVSGLGVESEVVTLLGKSGSATQIMENVVRDAVKLSKKEDPSLSKNIVKGVLMAEANIEGVPHSIISQYLL